MEGNQIDKNSSEYKLKERIKELNCLYKISEIIEKNEYSLDIILFEVAKLIPSSWQYPEFTCASIELYNKEYLSSNFHKTEWQQSVDIIVKKEKAGSIKVYYLKKFPAEYESVFLKEERKLLNVIAERLGRVTEHIRLKIVSEHLKLKHDKEKQGKNLVDILTRIVGMYLPICDKCHSIHDKDGKWVPTAKYIQKIKGPDFTHGICPLCAKELFPEYED